MNDQELDQLLNLSAGKCRVPENFQPEVWARLATAEAAPSPLGRITRAFSLFERAPVAAAACAAFVAGGALLGYMATTPENAPETLYIRSVSPFHPANS